MNIHMTSNEWAQYIQTFEPETIEQAEQYYADLQQYAKGGNIESGIAVNRAKRLMVDFPQLDKTKLDRMKYEDRVIQNQIQEGFFK